MTDRISNLGPALAGFTASIKKRTDMPADAAPAPAGQVNSGGSAKALADPGFDASKVEAIRLAVAQGNYPLDARKIAESFASMERMFGQGAGFGG